MGIGDFMNVVEINVLVLAYLGDTIYENYVRHYLVSLGMNHVDSLQKESVRFVSAKNQAKYIEALLERNYFSQDELSIVHRARNYKSYSHPKNCDVITYKYATALEAVIGYLDCLGKKDRIDEIMKMILGGDLC